MDYAALIQSIVGLVGSVVGNEQGDKKRAEAMKTLEQQLALLQGMTPPDLTGYNVDSSAMAGLAEDPRLRDYQMQALDALGREAQYGGMTPEDALAYDKARSVAGSTEAGLRGAVEQSAAQRGMASSTGAMLGAMSAGQAATNRSSAMGLQAAADARHRYMQALDALGHGASGVRGQDWGFASDKAKAQDAINQFNAGQGLRAAQQQWQNQLGLANAIGGVRSGIAGQQNAAGDRSDARGAAYGAAAGDIGAGLWSGWGNSDSKDENDSGYSNNNPW